MSAGNKSDKESPARRDPLVWAAPGLLLAALLVLLLMIWLGGRSTPTEPPRQPADAQPVASDPLSDTPGIAPGEDPPPTAPHADPPKRPTLPPASTPLKHSRPALEAAARAGDARAACRLAVQAALCDVHDASTVTLRGVEQALQRTQGHEAALIRQFDELSARVANEDVFCPEIDWQHHDHFKVDHRRWLEAAAQRGHVRAGLLLALHDPSARRSARAVASSAAFEASIAFGSPADYPPSAYLATQLDVLLQRGLLAGDPLALEVAILRAAPEAGMSGNRNEFPLREPDARSFSVWVETWRRLFPDVPLSTAIETAHQQAQDSRTEYQRDAIAAQADGHAAAWPGAVPPPAPDFDLQPGSDICEPSENAP